MGHKLVKGSEHRVLGVLADIAHSSGRERKYQHADSRVESVTRRR